MGIRPGDRWGTPYEGVPDLVVEGTDTDLARVVAEHPGALIRYRPTADSDLARNVGLNPAAAPLGVAVPMDVLELDGGRCALNMVVFGTAPDSQRWYTRSVDLGPPYGSVCGAVVATGQFLRGLDLVPRGHPGDGRAELQVYRLARRDRSGMRTRLRSGSHVPHPAIETRSVRSVTVSAPAPVAVEIDGRSAGTVQDITVRVVANAYRLAL